MESTQPTVEQIRALDGKNIAMLDAREEAVLNFFRTQGRKYGVDIQIINEADPKSLSAALSHQPGDQMLKNPHSRIGVTVNPMSFII